MYFHRVKQGKWLQSCAKWNSRIKKIQMKHIRFVFYHFQLVVILLFTSVKLWPDLFLERCDANVAYIHILVHHAFLRRFEVCEAHTTTTNDCVTVGLNSVLVPREINLLSFEIFFKICHMMIT